MHAIVARLGLKAKRHEARAWMEAREKEDWVVALRKQRPVAVYFLPLYERIRERYPHFRYELDPTRTWSVRFVNYPVIDCGPEGLIQPPLLALATNDELRNAPELVTAPEEIDRLYRERRRRRRRRSGGHHAHARRVRDPFDATEHLGWGPVPIPETDASDSAAD